MRPGFGGDAETATVHVGHRAVLALADTITALRDEAGQADDVPASLPWFLSRSAVWRVDPAIVLLHRFGRPWAATLWQSRRAFGVPTGLFKAGNLTGEGAVIAPAAQRPEALEHAARILLESARAHTVLASLQQPHGGLDKGTATAAAVEGTWHRRPVPHVLDLRGGTDALRQRLGPKLRRNLGYYRRRAERDFGCRFLPALTAEQSRAAVLALHRAGPHKCPRGRALRHEAALRGTEAGFAMALTDPHGNWLAYLAGWRQAHGTSIEWQLNRTDLAAASLSTALRAFLIDHEVQAGTPSLDFVGGTSPAWARACRPQSCADLLATRPGPLGTLARAAAGWLRPGGQVAQLLRRHPATALPGNEGA